ncbi:MFS transporter [Jongsikchunia kroppenstedtii]|uniref:MFS transporter n=1 Tax=Jongsikchunia kroppenstedtii TaxID=1121721 RepID=UPI000371A986|nr:MFS transporter [Jongsikchunia kroppenstedtii]
MTDAAPLVSDSTGRHEAAGGSRWHAFVRSFRVSPGLSRLLTVRLISQFTDGLFQAALGTAILFNPERHADPLAVAAGMAVLLLPYSVIGPFAGALLDHWDRRTVLIWANVLRAALIGMVSLTIATGAADGTVLVCALAVTGASRFVASGLSAGLPHVAERDLIVGMNSFFTTAGAAALGVGAGAAVGLRLIFGSGNAGSAATTLGAVVAALAGAALAVGFDRLQLGPDRPDTSGALNSRRHPSGSVTRAIAVGLVHGGRAVERARPVAAALAAMAAHRWVFGFNTLMLLILSKHSSIGGGMSGVGMMAALTAVGMFIAAAITPIAVGRVGRRHTLMIAMTVGIVAESALATFNPIIIGVAATVLGLVGQTAKLCGDSAMQLDIDDAWRGQAFAFQDAVFNVTFVSAIAVAAVCVAPDGRTPALAWAGAAVFAVGLLVVAVVHTQRHQAPVDDAVQTGPQRAVAG